MEKVLNSLMIINKCYKHFKIKSTDGNYIAQEIAERKSGKI